MAQETVGPRRPRFLIVGVGVIILLVFLYFYRPFEEYFTEGIRDVDSSNIVFWSASLVGILAYMIAHWRSFRHNIFRGVTHLDIEALVFDTLQIAILVAAIFCAGAILQEIEMLAEHLINRGTIIGPVFGGGLLSIIFLFILAVAFYLLHRMVRGFRVGWRPGKTPPRMSSTGAPSEKR